MPELRGKQVAGGHGGGRGYPAQLDCSIPWRRLTLLQCAEHHAWPGPTELSRD